MLNKKYELIEDDHRYEYEDLDVGDLFLMGEDLCIRTQDSALSLLHGKKVLISKGTMVVRRCKLAEI